MEALCVGGSLDFHSLIPFFQLKRRLGVENGGVANAAAAPILRQIQTLR
jgi:hypothetical protein